MNDRIILIKDWINKRSQRDKFYLFFGGFILIFLIFFIFFFYPISVQKKELSQRMIVMSSELAQSKQQINNIKDAINTPLFFQMVLEKKKLTLELAKAQQMIEELKADLFSPNEVVKLTESILTQKRNNGILISLEEFPVEVWPHQEGVDKTNLLNGIASGYQHSLMIQFHNDYFGSLDYLKVLEKISKHVFWDHMDLKVLEYPKSNVEIKFHVLSLEKI